jgi:hypothetical protein
LYGLPDPIGASWLGLAADLLRHGGAGRFIWESRRIQGWIRGQEALAVWEAGSGLRDSAVIVEIGAFLGCSTVLLAGTCRRRRHGTVHTIDPFDGSGDDFSIPIYREIVNGSRRSLRERFDANIRRAGVSDFLKVHQTTAEAAAASWHEPIDMLYLDGDQSPAGARAAFQLWTPFLRSGGVIAINNSAEGAHPPNHDGSLRVVREFLVAPHYQQIHRVGALTFAKRC